jgi:hypothetical protein
VANGLDRIAQADDPAGGAARPGNELQRRLGQLPDAHPSSARYEATQLVGDRHEQPDTRTEPDRQREEPPGLGWQACEVRDHPHRPNLDGIRLTAERARHILDGDGPGTPGGGHRHGAGRPGKTEFPAAWSDRKVAAAVEDVARDPQEAQWQTFNSRWRVTGERERVRVTAVLLADGQIWTAWPEPGGRGVRQNPKA